MFSFNLLVITWRWGDPFEIGRTRPRGWKNVGRRWTRWLGGLENWTVFMDVIWVSSLILSANFNRFFCYLFDELLYVYFIRLFLRIFSSQRNSLKDNRDANINEM